VVEQLNTYREQLSLPGAFSSQLIKRIFNGIAKPAYWHGGQGEAVIKVREPATVTADEIPRLHSTWLLDPV
jgi:pyruvate/2-oxoglutarate/acetoin dehydrogenase E1 component